MKGSGIMSFDWLDKIFSCPELMRMGHGQNMEKRSLGLGWLYYALVRVEKPRSIVCIGSWRGFVPIVMAQALVDNGDGGRLAFIDPSLVDNHWKQPSETKAWFSGFGLDNIDHHCMTTQEFVKSEAYGEIKQVDMLFVDGMHTAEQARFDHMAFDRKLVPDGIVMFHDSVRRRKSRIYDRDNPYEHTVVDYVNELKQRKYLQIMDFPLASSVTVVRKTPTYVEEI